MHQHGFLSIAHVVSTDLVHWEDRGVGPAAIHETYDGMDSDDSPCSGCAPREAFGVWSSICV